MRAAIVAAVVAALVGGGSAIAAARIDGRSIRPHSIPLNRLAHRPIGKRGPRGLQGLQGLQGVQGVQGSPGTAGPEGPHGMSIYAYPNPENPGRCVDIYQEVHQYTDLQVLVDTICAPGAGS